MTTNHRASELQVAVRANDTKLFASLEMSKLQWRIASPEMLLCCELLPHLICSPPRFIVGGKHGAGQHGDA